jgi:hypothetical protein
VFVEKIKTPHNCKVSPQIAHLLKYKQYLISAFSLKHKLIFAAKLAGARPRKKTLLKTVFGTSAVFLATAESLLHIQPNIISLLGIVLTSLIQHYLTLVTLVNGLSQQFIHTRGILPLNSYSLSAIVRWSK